MTLAYRGKVTIAELSELLTSALKLYSLGQASVTRVSEPRLTAEYRYRASQTEQRIREMIERLAESEVVR